MITKENILEASDMIFSLIHRTPVLTSQAINQLSGADIYFKCENFQKAGAFKMRGASHAILQLDNENKKKGVATHSSGNHAAALSLAALKLGIQANVVMPSNSSQVKIDAVKSYGGKITFCEPNLEARESTLQAVLQKTHATEIHPYNNRHIIMGQATAALELIQSTSELNYIIAPVGGGGLLSGTSLSVHYFSSGTLTIGAEPEGASDAFLSMAENKIIPSINPYTIADGLRTSLGSLTFPIINQFVDQILLASDSEIISAMKIVWERMKIIIEPSSAVALAVIFKHPELFSGKRIGIIISGGNVDLSKLPF
jgi:threonine dehydratase